MGAQEFEAIADGPNVHDAFHVAREQALWENGHGGYTGTIAEKSQFVVIGSFPRTEEEARTDAENLINADDPRIRDKWGPAGAIRIKADELPEGQQRWFFFGIASS